jgi:D-alanyl-D-alanine carboxypeptidase (penicillin-binding protein 5/6)
MFSIILSIFIIFAPFIVHSPTAVLNNDNVNQKMAASVSEEILVQQTEGDSQVAGLPRAMPRAPKKKQDSQSLGIVTTAKSAFVFDEGTGTVLFAKDPKEKSSLASLTKLMTVLVFLDQKVDWNKKIMMTRADDREGGIVYARSPDEVTVKDLFNMTLVGSVNNAAIALARSTGFLEKDFVALMNKKAGEIGLEDTTFADPTGLLPANQGTARDVAKLLAAVMDNDEARTASIQKKYVFNPANSQKVYYVKSTDELLWSFLAETPYNFIGGKTGYIEESKYNLAVEVERDGHRVIAVVLGSDTAEDRFIEIKGLIDWVFENYKW